MKMGKTEEPQEVQQQTFVSEVVEQMKENDEFLRSNASETLHELIGLVHDSMNYTGIALKKGYSEYLSNTMPFFFYHVLTPFSYALQVDLLAGNLPVCFMQLRFMLEALARCYLADLDHTHLGFFQERLEALEQTAQKARTRDWELMKRLGEELELDGKVIALWGKLSQRWSHLMSQGIVENIAQAMEKGDLPSWAMILPTSLSVIDTNDLDELRKRISELRAILQAAVKKYETTQ